MQWGESKERERKKNCSCLECGDSRSFHIKLRNIFYTAALIDRVPWDGTKMGDQAAVYTICSNRVLLTYQTEEPSFLLRYLLLDQP